MYSYRVFGWFFISLCLLLLSQVSAGKSTIDSIEWKSLVRKEYTLQFTNTDKNRAEIIDNYLQSGIDHIIGFFRQPFPDKFNVYIFPNRVLLDKQWQKDWGDSAFQSQCWMIASGVAHRLDILSPNAWTNETCEHNANDSTEIRQVIWHELVHVFNGQYNPDHTFSYVEKLDWFVEGAATFVSGQLDEKRLQRVKQVVKENRVPATLDNFWKGQERYGLSGSMAGFIEKRYGREKLFELLKNTTKEAALKSLGISEIQLLDDWKNSFLHQ